MDPRDMLLLTDKVAIVTAAGGGIGKGVALLLAGVGANVAAVDIDPALAEATVTEITARGQKAVPAIADVRDARQIEEATQRTLQQFGHIDILVNVVGNLGGFSHAPLIETREEAFEEIVKRNLKSDFLFAKAVAPVMIRQKRGGSIVNIASGAAFRPYVNNFAYAAAKAGVVSLTQTLAMELAPYGIRVNCVSPGYTVTMTTQRSMTPERRAVVEQHVPLRRWGTPEDIARGVLFFVSEMGSYCTGETIRVDGGKNMSHLSSFMDREYNRAQGRT